MSSRSSRTACVLRYSPRASFFHMVARSMGRRITCVPSFRWIHVMVRESVVAAGGVHARRVGARTSK